MKQKIKTIVIALIIILTIFTLPLYATETVFIDMPEDWSTVSLQKAVKNGLLRGNEGKINPQGNLTRAEMATVINRSFGSQNKAPIETFKDVSTNAWYYEDMAKAVGMKTFVGGGDNTLRPDSYITREEVFAVISRSFKLSTDDESVLDSFKDKDQISPWAKQATATLVTQNIVSGFDGQLNPKQNISRAEFAKIMDNLVKFYINESKTYTTLPKGNIMINKPDVTIKDVTIEGNLIIGDGVGEGNVTLENVNIKNRLVVRGGGNNSIYVKGNSTIENIIVGKIQGPVRVVSEQNTKVTNVVIDGFDDVNIEGKFSNLAIKSPNIAVNSKNSTITTLTLEGENSKINIDENSTVDALTIKALNTNIFVAEKALVNKIEVFGQGANISGNIDEKNIIIKAENVTVEKTTPAVSGAVGGLAGGGGTTTQPVVDYAQIMEKSLNNSWEEFSDTVNDQNKLITSYSDSSRTINIIIKAENRSESILALVSSSGLKSGLGDVLANSYINKVSSGSYEVTTTNKSIDSLQNELMPLLSSWVGSNLFKPVDTYLIGSSHSLDLHCTADDGTEATYTYTFDFN